MTYLNPPDLGGLSRPTGIPTGEKMKKNSMYFFQLTVSLFVLALIQNSCNTTEPGNNEKLYIEVADVSCTESWIEVETSGVNLPAELKLYRDNELAREIIVNEKSTIIYDSLLLPSQSYKYQVKLPGITSEEITVTTMDTTSHNFTWQTYTFGEHASSVLYDAAIIDENNIWAVGEIYLNDSTGRPNPHAYNAVHWDGVKWTLHRIMFYTICGQQSRTSYPARAITAFSEKEIWVAGGGRQLAKISGTIHLETICPPFSIFINKIWGTSSENLYVVGDNGNIARYDGSSWQKIESGTDIMLRDILGCPNGEIAWVSGYDGSTGMTVLLNIENNTVNKVQENQILDRTGIEYEGFIKSIWTNNKKRLFVLTSEKIYRKVETRKAKSIYDIEENFWGGYNKIRGNEINDIVVGGFQSSVQHYNGISWREYEEIRDETIILHSIAIRDNIIVAVGEKNINMVYYQAALLLGRR